MVDVDVYYRSWLWYKYFSTELGSWTSVVQEWICFSSVIGEVQSDSNRSW